MSTVEEQLAALAEQVSVLSARVDELASNSSRGGTAVRTDTESDRPKTMKIVLSTEPRSWEQTMSELFPEQ